MAAVMPDRVKLAVDDVSKTFRVRGAPGQPDTLLPVLRHSRDPRGVMRRIESSIAPWKDLQGD